MPNSSGPGYGFESGRQHSKRPAAVASAWHTLIVLLTLLSLSLAGARSGNLPFLGAHRRAMGYVLLMAFEWITVGFIWYGVSRRGLTLGNLIGGSWQRPVLVLRDLAIAIGFLIIAGVLVQGVSYFVNPVPNQAIRNLVPQSPTEVALYLMLAGTAGFCEEVIHRGYLQRQFAALTRSAIGGILLQGIEFGVGHGYQGWRFILIIAVLGTMFGTLAHWRRSLRPGMIAHFVQDSAEGLLARHLIH
jgi:membrane protease YdiL (CAAX protease family)